MVYFFLPNPQFQGASQNAGLATNQYLKILYPFFGTFTKPGMASTSN